MVVHLGEPSCVSSGVTSATGSQAEQIIAARGYPAPYGARLAGSPTGCVPRHDEQRKLHRRRLGAVLLEGEDALAVDVAGRADDQQAVVDTYCQRQRLLHLVPLVLARVAIHLEVR